MLELLLANAEDVNAVDEEDADTTALMCAVRTGLSHNVGLLINAGADVDAVDRKGCTAVHHAVTQQDEDILKILTDNGADPCIAGGGGLTALHACAASGSLSCLRIIIAATNPHNGGVDGYSVPTAMHHAARQGQVAIVRALIDAGGNVASGRGGHGTPLHSAAASGHTDVLELLLSCASSVNWMDAMKATPLHVAGNARVAATLLAQGSRVADEDDTKATPLHRAARAARADVVEVLLQAGSNVRALDRSRQTPLHHAAQAGSTQTASLLLSKDGGDGLLVLAEDRWRRHALHFAASENHTLMCELLLEHGARVSACDNTNKTPLHYACERESLSVVATLLSRGADINGRGGRSNITPLHVAAGINASSILQLLLSGQSRGEVDARDKEGKTPLMYAARSGHTDAIKMLIENGAACQCRDRPNRGALHHAVIGGHLPAVQAIVASFMEKRAGKLHVEVAEEGDMHGVDDAGMSPLHYAAQSGHEHLVGALLAKGAPPNAQDRGAKTPLHYAALEGHSRVVEHLLKAGADPGVMDSQGKTALTLARNRGHVDVIRCAVFQTKKASESRLGVFEVAKQLEGEYTLYKISPRIVVIGCCRVELSVAVPRLPQWGETVQGLAFDLLYGGKGAAQAVVASRLGGTVSLISRVGNDGYGKDLKRYLEAQALDVTTIYTSKRRSTDVATLATQDHGAHATVNIPSATLTLSPSDVAVNSTLIGSCGVVLVDLNVPQGAALEAVKVAQQHGKPVVVTAVSSTMHEDILRFSTAILIESNRVDEHVLGSLEASTREGAVHAAASLIAKGQGNNLHCVVVSIPDDGYGVAIWHAKDARATTCFISADEFGNDFPAFDGFAAAFAFFLPFEQLSLMECVRRAAYVEASAAQGAGSAVSFPGREKLLEMAPKLYGVDTFAPPATPVTPNRTFR